MWEISEGNSNFLYIMTLVPPKALGSIAHLDIIH